MTVRYPSIRSVQIAAPDLRKLAEAVESLREAMEILTRQRRKAALDSAVSVRDLLEIGVISEEQARILTTQQ